MDALLALFLVVLLVGQDNRATVLRASWSSLAGHAAGGDRPKLASCQL